MIARIAGDNNGRTRRSQMSYLALPGKVVLLLPASVQGNQEVCTRIPVLNREAGIGHLLPGSYLATSVGCPNKTMAIACHGVLEEPMASENIPVVSASPTALLTDSATVMLA